jgi:[ribosomal protein S5]-alanine N-acetyltransferase
MIGPMELLTRRLLLREFRVEDLAAVQIFAGDVEVTRYTDWGPNSRDATAAFLTTVARDAVVVPRADYQLAIVERATGSLIGAVHLGITSDEHRRGEIGYTIARSRWGKAYATEAAAAMLDFGFTMVHLHKITATCDPENVASARVLTKIGMSREGYLRQHLLIRGQWRDRLLFAAIFEDS